MGIIAGAIGVSSNGRTRDFGSLYHGSNPCAPTKIKQCPQGAFFILLYVTDCTISFSDWTAKHYQCFVRVSENQRFPKTLVGASQAPVCATDHTSRLRRFVWRATRTKQLSRSSVHRSLGVGGLEYKSNVLCLSCKKYSASRTKIHRSNR